MSLGPLIELALATGVSGTSLWVKVLCVPFVRVGSRGRYATDLQVSEAELILVDIGVQWVPAWISSSLSFALHRLSYRSSVFDTMGVE